MGWFAHVKCRMQGTKSTCGLLGLGDLTAFQLLRPVDLLILYKRMHPGHGCLCFWLGSVASNWECGKSLKIRQAPFSQGLSFYSSTSMAIYKVSASQ